MRTPRVLHVVGGLGAGGAETWLMHMLRLNDRRECEIDVLVHTEEPRVNDAEALALGVRLLRCPDPSRIVQYTRSLRRLFREHAPYDVIHSHVHHFSGLIVREAARAGIPVRIAHSHSDRRAVEANVSPMRRAYLALMKRWIQRYATVGLGVADGAGASLFGASWPHDPRWQRFYLGINLTPFQAPVDRRGLRRALGIAENALVVGHVGRFSEPKNHNFLLRIAREVVAQRPDARLLLVGDGPLRGKIEAEVATLGLADRVIFAGVRQDIAALMRGVMDVLLLPSLYEGLPLVLMETQAAALPALASSRVTREADVITSLVHREDLTTSPVRWAERTLVLAQERGHVSAADAVARMAESPFCVETGWRHLRELYGLTGTSIGGLAGAARASA